MHQHAVTPTGRLLLDGEAIEKTLSRIAHEIIEANADLDRVALVGIHTRGVSLAHRLRRLIEEFATRAKEPQPAKRLDLLTDREREVVGLVAEGLSNEEIAERLIMSAATSRTHVSRAMIKVGARDRAQLVVFAYETGLVRPGWQR